MYVTRSSVELSAVITLSARAVRTNRGRHNQVILPCCGSCWDHLDGHGEGKCKRDITQMSPNYRFHCSQLLPDRPALFL